MLFCAEIGSNHKGSKALAFELIRQAKRAGADIAKFQIGHHPSDELRCIDPWAFELQEYCDYMGIEFMASVFSARGIALGEELQMQRWKIPSRRAFESLKPDMAYDDLAETVVKLAAEVFWTGPLYVREKNVRCLWCITEYPTMPWQLTMPAFSREGYYGFSDHSYGLAASLLAISRGALYIERHFTLDKTEASIRDNAFSSSPEEFALLVREGRELGRLVRCLK